MNQGGWFPAGYCDLPAISSAAPASLLAQKFVYVNNNISGPNSVSGFATNESGAGFTLIPIGGSRF